MEPAELAVSALTVLSPYLKKGAEALVEGAAKDVWESMRKLFTKEKKEKDLERLRHDYENEQLIKEITAHLTSMLYANSDAKKELETLIQASKAQSAPQQVTTGVGNIVVGGKVVGSTLRTNSQK